MWGKTGHGAKRDLRKICILAVFIRPGASLLKFAYGRPVLHVVNISVLYLRVRLCLVFSLVRIVKFCKNLFVISTTHISATKGKVLHAHFIEKFMHFLALSKKWSRELVCTIASCVFGCTPVGARWDHSWRGKTGLSPVLPRTLYLCLFTFFLSNTASHHDDCDRFKHYNYV